MESKNINLNHTLKSTLYKSKIRKPRATSWSIHEQTLYLQFLKQNKEMMEDPSQRKTNRVFKQMAVTLETRTSIQAKSHHQKLLQRYKNIPQIISYVTRNIRELTRLQKGKAEYSQPESTITGFQNNPEEEFGKEGIQVQERSEEKMPEDEIWYLASYCSFFDEFSANYRTIEGGFIMDEYQVLI